MNLSLETLKLAYQALAAVPATNAQQAGRLATALMELELFIANGVVPVPEGEPNASH